MKIPSTGTSHSDSQGQYFCNFLTIGLSDILGDIPWNGEWLGLGATFGVFNGENQFDVKNLTDASHWISEVVLNQRCTYQPQYLVSNQLYFLWY